MDVSRDSIVNLLIVFLIDDGADRFVVDKSDQAFAFVPDRAAVLCSKVDREASTRSAGRVGRAPVKCKTMMETETTGLHDGCFLPPRLTIGNLDSILHRIYILSVKVACSFQKSPFVRSRDEAHRPAIGSDI